MSFNKLPDENVKFEYSKAKCFEKGYDLGEHFCKKQMVKHVESLMYKLAELEYNNHYGCCYVETSVLKHAIATTLDFYNSVGIDTSNISVEYCGLEVSADEFYIDDWSWL